MKFCDCLVSARRKAGFKTAYQFYVSNGGAKTWPFSFAHYTHIEKGRTLPKPDHLPFIISMMRFVPDRADMLAILDCYLREYLGDGAGAEYITGMLADKERKPAPVRDHAVWNKQANSHHLSPEQLQTMAADACTYWCSVVLTLDNTEYTARSMSSSIGYPGKKVSLSFEKLRRAGLAVKTDSGRYRNAYGDKMLTLPAMKMLRPEMSRIEGYMTNRERNTGEYRLKQVLMLRMERGAMNGFKADLCKALGNSQAYNTTVKTADTGFFVLRAEIVELGNF